MAVVTLKLYGDESADETKDRVFAVAAVIGTEREWLLAERDWNHRTKGKPFHANKCEWEFSADRDSQKHNDNLEVYRDLTTILAGSYLGGMAVALDLRSFRAFFPNPVPDLA